MHPEALQACCCPDAADLSPQAVCLLWACGFIAQVASTTTNPCGILEADAELKCTSIASSTELGLAEPSAARPRTTRSAAVGRVQRGKAQGAGAATLQHTVQRMMAGGQQTQSGGSSLEPSCKEPAMIHCSIKHVSQSMHS